MPVATPVRVAPAGEAPVVMTGGSTGEAKRLRNDRRVELQECTARGRVRPGAPVVHGTAEIVTAEREQRPLLGALAAEYGWQLRLVSSVEGILGADRDRVVLRITDPAPR